MDEIGRRPTGADVARLAGVTQSSVSRVFTGKAAGRVSEEIEQRIRKAAAELGYQPHVSGRSLRSGRTSAIGLVVTDFENPFFGPLSRGAQREALARGQTMVLMEAAFDQGAFLPYRALDAGLVDGLLLFSVEPPELRQTASARITLIESELEPFSSVTFDSTQALRDSVSHLLSLGHERIAYLGASIDRWAFRRRRADWFSALRALAPDVIPLERSSALNLDAAVNTVRLLVEGSSRPTAIFCADDLLAAGVFRAAAELGLNIPGDLSVVTFGGTVVGAALWPRPTSIIASGAELGEAAVKVHLAGDRGSHSSLLVNFEPRNSTGPAPR